MRNFHLQTYPCFVDLQGSQRVLRLLCESLKSSAKEIMHIINQLTGVSGMRNIYYVGMGIIFLAFPTNHR